MIAVYDPPSQYQFSPIVEIRRAGSGQVLNTIMTREAFITEEMAIEFGFGRGREWVDERLSESPSKRRLSPWVRVRRHRLHWRIATPV